MYITMFPELWKEVSTMEAECPHCHKGIRLVGAGELNESFGIGPNALQHARERGMFPEPWLSFGNRNIFLQNDVEDYVASRGRQKLEKTVSDLEKALDTLPARDRTAALKLLQRIGEAPKAAAKKR